MFIDPNYEIDERIKKLRQANFKLEYKQRMNSGNPGAVRKRAAGPLRAGGRKRQRCNDSDDYSDD